MPAVNVSYTLLPPHLSQFMDMASSLHCPSYSVLPQPHPIVPTSNKGYCWTYESIFTGETQWLAKLWRIGSVFHSALLFVFQLRCKETQWGRFCSCLHQHIVWNNSTEDRAESCGLTLAWHWSNPINTGEWPLTSISVKKIRTCSTEIVPALDW